MLNDDSTKVEKKLYSFLKHFVFLSELKLPTEWTSLQHLIHSDPQCMRYLNDQVSGILSSFKNLC